MADLDWVDQSDRIGKTIQADAIWAAGDYKIMVHKDFCQLYLRLGFIGEFETLDLAKAKANDISRAILSAEEKAAFKIPAKIKKLKSTDFKRFKGDRVGQTFIAETDFGEYWLTEFGVLDNWSFHFYKRKGSPESWMTATDWEHSKRDLLVKLNKHYAKLQKGKPVRKLRFTEQNRCDHNDPKEWTARDYSILMYPYGYELYFQHAFLKVYKTKEAAELRANKDNKMRHGQ